MTDAIGAIDDVEFVVDFGVASIQDENLSSEEELKSPEPQTKTSSEDRQERLRTETLCRTKLQAVPHQLMNILIKYGSNKDGIPPLLYATKMGDLESVKMLINHGADPFTRDANRGQQALYYALHSKNLDMVEFFLEKGLDPNSSDGTQPCWYEAVKFNDIKLFDLLIDNGLIFNPDYKFFCPSNSTQFSSQLPLRCVDCGSLDLLKHVLSKGAKLPPPGIGSHGDDLVVRAISHRGGQWEDKIECLKWLVEIGRLDLKNVSHPLYGDHPAKFNISNAYPEFVSYLLDKGHIALDHDLLSSVCNWSDLLLLVIERGIDINSKGHIGRTVLHNMVSRSLLTNEHFERIKLLLENGADVNAQDDKGITPLELAQKPQIRKLLIDYGAKQ
ncbi:MAG: hypothetical protein K1060chlam2_01170 [Chlamydiae bacterium]|nr:hypothetical protein [Chlamydiota bacterium]